jgi:hypothetical protein
VLAAYVYLMIINWRITSPEMLPASNISGEVMRFRNDLYHIF